MYGLVPEKILRLVYEPFYLAIYSCTAQRALSSFQLINEIFFSMSKLSSLIYKLNAKSRFILAGAASAVALRKGLWRDKQGFSPACPAAVCGEAYACTSPRQIHAGQEG